MNELAFKNDWFRGSYLDVVLTRGIMETISDPFTLQTRVAAYNTFNEDNDPYGEHDFGSLEYEGRLIYWKIDYYDQERKYWCDPQDDKCRRVLTIMLAEDW